VKEKIQRKYSLPLTLMDERDRVRSAIE